jgi:hypothetical protein
MLHGGNPVHVAVTHQGEMCFDAFGGKSLGEGLVDRNILHSLRFLAALLPADGVYYPNGA